MRSELCKRSNGSLYILRLELRSGWPSERYQSVTVYAVVHCALFTSPSSRSTHSKIRVQNFYTHTISTVSDPATGFWEVSACSPADGHANLLEEGDSVVACLALVETNNDGAKSNLVPLVPKRRPERGYDTARTCGVWGV